MPYTVEVIPDEGGFVARVKELSGRMTQGDTWEEVGNAYRRPRLYHALVDEQVEPPFVRKEATR